MQFKLWSSRMRKVIQISTAMTTDKFNLPLGKAIALCDDGTVWELILSTYGQDEIDWVRLKDIPQERESITVPDFPIANLNLGRRINNILSSKGIDTISDLVKFSEVNLIKLGLGKKSLIRIKDALAKHELSLNTSCWR